jgi:4-hydroxybenzoate polyprenyltransferase
MTTVLPDAAPANWVDRHAPPGLRPWLKLGRFDRPNPISLLMLPGWQGIALADAMAGRPPDLWLLFLFFVGAALMRAAGCAYNDIVDRDIDAKVARTAMRPVASGQISVKAAWGFVVACSLASLVILLSFNFVAVALGVASLALVAIYPFMKRITWWPQAWLGLTFNWGIPLGFAAAQSVAGKWTVEAAGVWFRFSSAEAHHGHLGPWEMFVELPSLPPWAAPLLLYTGAVFWTLGYDTIYAVQDLEDDALAGVKSSARRLGARAPIAVGVFYVIALALAAATALVAHLAWPFWLFFALYALALMHQPARLKLDDPALALRLFKANTTGGVILFFAIAAGSWRG